ncbi:MAG: hypothetical protein HY362_03815 [Candidatus Aenigmarchaeota archaeon]|nr:hypothetical protein [Candidatus Aenigmarchaeota archaeon]
MAEFSLPFNLLDQTFYLPFVLVFAIVFGILQTAGVLKSKPVNAVVALGIALFAATNSAFTTTFFQILPGLAWFFVVFFFIIFLAKALGIGKDKTGKEKVEPFTLIVVGLAFIAFLMVGITAVPNIPSIGSQNLAFIIGLVLIFFIFWIAYKYDPKQAG